MKPSKEGDSLFEYTKSLTEMSQMGNLYGRLAELKDQKMHIQIRIDEVEKQINWTPPYSFEDGIKMWREEIGQYYDEHFSEEEMEILFGFMVQVLGRY